MSVRAMNALSKNLVASMTEAIDAVKFDKNVRVLIIKGKQGYMKGKNAGVGGCWLLFSSR